MTDVAPRRLSAVLAVAFTLEAGLYSAVTPILQLLSRRFDLSESSAGLLLSNYSAGVVVGSLVCVPIVARVNARAAAAAGLAMLAVSTVVFAWADSDVVLLCSRTLGGVAGGATWTACVCWLLSEWPAVRRGEALSSAMAPAVVGTIVGPLIGTLAVQFGVGWPYSALGIACLLASVGVLRMPRPNSYTAPHARVPSSSRSANELAVLGVTVVALAGVAVGAINLARPLMLERAGAHDVVGGTAFVLAAVATILSARPLGRVVDRLGATATAGVALAALVVLMTLMAADPGVGSLVALIVALLLATSACTLSASAMLTNGADRAGWSIYLATALIATSWGIGETGGAFVAGVGFERVGVRWTVVSGAALMVLGLAAVLLMIPRLTRQRRG